MPWAYVWWQQSSPSMPELESADPRRVLNTWEGGSSEHVMVVVGKHFAFLLIVVLWEIPT